VLAINTNVSLRSEMFWKNQLVKQTVELLTPGNKALCVPSAEHAYRLA
jgi:hypothetical protein